MVFFVILTALSSVFFTSTAIPLTGEYGDAFEGDMILTAAQRAAIDKATNFPTNDNEESRNGFVDVRRRWPDKTVVYHIKENVFDEKQIAMIHTALSDIANQTCVKFRERESENEHAVIIQGKQDLGCSSELGFIFDQPNQMLNLAKNCFVHGSIIHEMLHTMGFEHMQNTYDRDQFVTIYWQNVKYGKEHNFRMHNTDTLTDFGVPYDYGSVMHYYNRAFSKNGKDTIVPKQNNVKIGQRNGLSKSDVMKVNKMYECL